MLAIAFGADFHSDAPPLEIDRAKAEAAANAALKNRAITLGPEWQQAAATKLASEDGTWLWHKFVWREGGHDTYAHLVGSYDGTTLSFYVNGALAAQLTAPFAPNDVNPLRIGGGATEGDGDFFFEGDIDEVAVYGAALSEDRILAHYVAGFPLTTPPTISAQPQSQFALPGSTVTFSVGASGGQPLSYAWQFNGQTLASASASTLRVTNVSALNVGNYFVIVSNAGGRATSRSR